jgi:hypothetical protein
MKISRMFAALLVAALCIGVSWAEAADYRLVTKSVKWGTWSGAGIVTSSLQDTSQTVFTGGLDADTTAAIDLSDFAWDAFVPRAGAASVIQGGMKVWIVSDGVMDNVDSLYYAIEQSPDGLHWVNQTGLIVVGSVAWKGVKAGNDQSAVAGNAALNGLCFTVHFDADDPDGIKATQVASLGNWYLAPFVRLHIRSSVTNEMLAARCLVTYLARK